MLSRQPRRGQSRTGKAPIIFHAGAWWDLKNLNRVLPSMDQLDARIANGTAQLLNQLVKSVARAAQLPPVVVPLEVSACTEEEALRTLQVCNSSATAR